MRAPNGNTISVVSVHRRPRVPAQPRVGAVGDTDSHTGSLVLAGILLVGTAGTIMYFGKEARGGAE